ncbi:YopX family protein [Staphylococcus epidermidis]|uniref:YopX family protein n=1 Tax=Staphylococcus epidermidis TaxID=1282 RepID=UPI0034D6B802
MILKFREWEAVREEIFMSYGVREDFDDSFKITFSHMEDLDIINDDGSINRVVMMSTGLKDVNDIEIYEGDIVRIFSNDGIDYNAQIIFKDGGFCSIDGTKDNYSTIRYKLCEFDLNLDVIGNIYEDIELLDEDLVNVERKAKAFDEIQSNLSHVLDLGKYETLDYKDCQILKSILQEVKND